MALLNSGWFNLTHRAHKKMLRRLAHGAEKSLQTELLHTPARDADWTAAMNTARLSQTFNHLSAISSGLWPRQEYVMRAPQANPPILALLVE
jgi:hypothetical protein